jgi:GntR family transcriptional regulator
MSPSSTLSPTPLAETPRRRADRARQVADVLRRQVRSGQYADGLPAESALVAEFATTRNTVRAALELLRAEGLVDRCPGVGTTVVGQKHSHGLERLQGLAEVFDGRGTVHNEVRALAMTRPPSAVREHLRLGPHDEVLYVERLRHLDGVPLSLDLTYLAPDLGGALLGRDLAANDVFTLLEEVAGRPLGHADLAVEAVAADPHSAAVLGVPRHAPLLMVERLTHLADDRPVDLEFIRFRADRLSLRGSTHRHPEEDQR